RPCPTSRWRKAGTRKQRTEVQSKRRGGLRVWLPAIDRSARTSYLAGRDDRAGRYSLNGRLTPVDSCFEEGYAPAQHRRRREAASLSPLRRHFFVRAAICFLFFSPSSSTDPSWARPPVRWRRSPMSSAQRRTIRLATVCAALRVRFSHPISHRTPHYRVGNGATEQSAARRESYIFYGIGGYRTRWVATV